MKKLFIVSAIALSGLIYNTADAQIGIHLGFHIGPRRVYTAPVVVEEEPVYNSNEDYYYLPDVNAYYSVNEQCYYYSDGDNWVSAAYLPGAYRDYDWRNERRFEVREARPYLHNDFYRSRYNGNTERIRWGHRHNYFDEGYARADFNNGYRYDDHRFYNRREAGYSQPQQSYRMEGRGAWDGNSRGGYRNHGMSRF